MSENENVPQPALAHDCGYKTTWFLLLTFWCLFAPLVAGLSCYSLAIRQMEREAIAHGVAEYRNVWGWEVHSGGEFCWKDRKD